MTGPPATRVELHEARERGGTVRVRGARFAPPGGGPAEWHLAVDRSSAATFDEQLRELERSYEAARESFGIPAGSAVFRRLFVAGLQRRQGLLSASPLLGSSEDPVALSVVEQPPLPAGAPALWAYHVVDEGGLDKERVEGGLLLRRGAGRVAELWTAGLSTHEDAAGPSEQTRSVLDAYVRVLAGQGATLADHAVRTWVFVAGIDEGYAGMVAARRELFAAEGLTDETHFIASTGIEGRRADPTCVVSLDALAMPGLAREQVRYLVAPKRLGAPSAYGPTFERGVRIAHGDRARVLVSGSASIDPEGRVVHEGDVLRQLDRAAGNVEALLRDGGAAEADVVQMIVYVRERADGDLVRPAVEERYPGVPYVLVQAAVCRPAWLVELECMALVHTTDARFPPF